MNRALSIPEWHRLAEEGNAPPVRIMLNGGSMHPLIRWNRDYVTVVPVKGETGIGDIVLFWDADRDRYVVHRVWDIKDGRVMTWGDHCKEPDGWLPLDAVWGKIVLIERGKRRIIPDPKKGVRWARFWHKGGIVYRKYKMYRAAIERRLKKLKMRGFR